MTGFRWQLSIAALAKLLPEVGSREPRAQLLQVTALTAVGLSSGGPQSWARDPASPGSWAAGEAPPCTHGKLQSSLFCLESVLTHKSDLDGPLLKTLQWLSTALRGNAGPSLHALAPAWFADLDSNTSSHSGLPSAPPGWFPPLRLVRTVPCAWNTLPSAHKGLFPSHCLFGSQLSHLLRLAVPYLYPAHSLSRGLCHFLCLPHWTVTSPGQAACDCRVHCGDPSAGNSTCTEGTQRTLTERMGQSRGLCGGSTCPTQ